MHVRINLALSGGGVKGIAYAGMDDAAVRRNFRWGNLAGTSAGAIAGALIAAGYRGSALWDLVQSFQFKNMQLVRSASNLPVAARFLEYALHSPGGCQKESLQKKYDGFFEQVGNHFRFYDEDQKDFPADKRNILATIATFAKEGGLFDGDYLEEWMYKALARKGVRTFADLRYGIRDPINPNGYKVRMTGMDCLRAKNVILPDDMAYYGIEPDRMEVASAVRISCSIPFAFKPVAVTKQVEGSKKKTFFLVDGGVFDAFPHWLVGNSLVPKIGFKLGSAKGKILSMETASAVIKTLSSLAFDIGIPKEVPPIRYVGEIPTGEISTLDFSLSDEEKKYLFNSGRQTARWLFNRYEQNELGFGRRLLKLLLPGYGKR